MIITLIQSGLKLSHGKMPQIKTKPVNIVENRAMEKKNAGIIWRLKIRKMTCSTIKRKMDQPLMS